MNERLVDGGASVLDRFRVDVARMHSNSTGQS